MEIRHFNYGRANPVVTQKAKSKRKRKHGVFSLRMRCPVTALEKIVVVLRQKRSSRWSRGKRWHQHAANCTLHARTLGNCTSHSNHGIQQKNGTTPTVDHHSHVHRRIAHDACWCDDAGSLIHVTRAAQLLVACSRQEKPSPPAHIALLCSGGSFDPDRWS
jgi:hypothetical protein